MFLLLNVIMYAGLIRSNNIPTLLQEQRDLIQSLLDEQKSRDLESSKPTSHQSITTLSRSLDCETYICSDQDSKEIDQPLGLKKYNLLIQKMLQEIEFFKCKLETTRHSRIKDGILNIHSGEIVRFQLEHGHSVPVDYSLFAERKLSSPSTRQSPEKNLQELQTSDPYMSAEIDPDEQYFRAGAIPLTKIGHDSSSSHEGNVCARKGSTDGDAFEWTEPSGQLNEFPITRGRNPVFKIQAFSGGDSPEGATFKYNGSGDQSSESEGDDNDHRSVSSLYEVGEEHHQEWAYILSPNDKPQHIKVEELVLRWTTLEREEK